MPPSSWLLHKDKIICDNQQDIGKNYFKFRENSEITSFEELRYFVKANCSHLSDTGLKKIIYAPFVTDSEIVLKPGPNNAEIEYIKMSDGGIGKVRIKNTNEFNYNHVKLVYLTSAVTSTDSYVFRNITIDKLYVNSQVPLNVSIGWGDGLSNGKVTYIPKGCLSAYQSAPFWNGPTTYIEYDFEADEDNVRP